MGLDTSHDAFQGAYSAFNSLRQEVARAIGGSHPPHYLLNHAGEIARDDHGYPIIDESLNSEMVYLPDKCGSGMREFLTHSDCDGDISAEMCVVVADELEEILQDMPEGGVGHIAARGGYREVLRKFIAGCRAAAAENKPLLFR